MHPVEPRCPWCEGRLARWWGLNPADPEDAEPHAECLDPDCDYNY